jgi:uncharacterized DUF497 family protein
MDGGIERQASKLYANGSAVTSQLAITIKLDNVYVHHIHSLMLNLSHIQGFQWDEGNGRKSADKHGVTQSEAEQAFFNEPLLMVADNTHSHNEPRYNALGHTDDGRFLHVTFTLRDQGHLIRVISARDMNRKERTCYEQEA